MVKRETFFIFKFWFVFVLLFQREAGNLFVFLFGSFIFVIWKAIPDGPMETLPELLVFLKKGRSSLKAVKPTVDFFGSRKRRRF